MSGSTSGFSQTLTGLRTVDLLQRDTIEAVAARTLGDASQWTVLVALNGLTWPYLTDDPTQASATVLLTTGTITVPGSGLPTSAPAVVDGTLFGTDISLAGGFLEVGPDGDDLLVSGAANLKQAITNRIGTDTNELPYYPDYGCDIYKLMGKRDSPVNEQLAITYVSKATQSDPRVASVQNGTADLTGDTIAVSCEAVTISGSTLPTGKITIPS
jgi:hypothetical protein